MTRRKLTDEELEQIAEKKWKKTPIFTSDEKVAYRAKNLTGPKTKEGKMRALKNLEVGRNSSENGSNFKHGGYIKKILNEDEQEIYFERKKEYMKDYDINASADEIILHTVLMEEVILYRLYKKQAEKPSLDIDRPLSECTKRLSKSLEDLGALRKQRLKQDDKTTTLNIATIAQQFHRELTSGNLTALLQQQQEEEKKYLEDKRNRETGPEVIDVEVDDEYEPE
jgi:hypothetical protein